MSTNNKSIGLFGFGVVGQGFYNFVDREGEKRIPTVVVKSNNKQRNNNEVEYITEGDYLLQNDNPSVIVEVINNDKEAFDIVSKALIKRKKVVSASKKLLATRLPELLALEQQYGGTLLYEAAVAGSIPIIRILNDFYIQEKIRDIKGIVNGSSNYILTKLFEGGAKYEEVLEEAKDLGFAEKDPTSDVGGFDALYKLVLLTLQGFGAIINPDSILRVGIQNITTEDIELAKNNELVIKQIAQAKVLNGKLELSILPTFVDSDSPLAKVNNEYNSVQITSDTVGQQVYSGKGAGSFPTGSSVYADVKAIDSGYRYKYKRSYLEINYESTKDVLLRLPQNYSADILPFKTTLITKLEDNLFYIRANEQEIRTNIDKIESLGISLLFFDNEELKNKLLKKIKEETPSDLKIHREKDKTFQLQDFSEN